MIEKLGGLVSALALGLIVTAALLGGKDHDRASDRPGPATARATPPPSSNPSDTPAVETLTYTLPDHTPPPSPESVEAPAPSPAEKFADKVADDIRQDYPEAIRVRCFPSGGPNELVCHITIGPTPARPAGGQQTTYVQVASDGSVDSLGGP